jgi:hypothetical protein
LSGLTVSPTLYLIPPFPHNVQTSASSVDHNQCLQHQLVRYAFSFLFFFGTEEKKKNIQCYLFTEMSPTQDKVVRENASFKEWAPDLESFFNQANGIHINLTKQAKKRVFFKEGENVLPASRFTHIVNQT